jgi:hypothetical protein
MTADIFEKTLIPISDEQPSIYIRRNDDGTVYAIIIYSTFPLDSSDNSIIAGAYYGYSGGACYESGFYVTDNENSEAYLIDYDELESRIDDGCDVSTHLKYLMQKIWEIIRPDDNTVYLTKFGLDLLQNAGSPNPFTSGDFDGDLLADVSAMWPIFCKFDN